MNAAAIGLIGVIVGALLAGVVNLVLDRRRRIAEARIAARLIDVELKSAETKINSAVGAAHWWIGDLLREAWRKHQSRLATNVSADALEAVAEAYALCAGLNDEHAAARKSEAEQIADAQGRPPAERAEAVRQARAENARPRGDVESFAQALSLARNKLADESKIRTRNPAQRMARWSPALALAIAVLVLAIFALLTPRVDVNSASVTAAMQSQLGHSMLVQCNPTATSDWDCTAYPRTWSSDPRTWSNLCPATSTASLLQFQAVDHAVAMPSAVPSDRTNTPQPIQFTANVDGGEVEALMIEKSGRVDRIRKLAGPDTTSNGLERILRTIFG